MKWSVCPLKYNGQTGRELNSNTLTPSEITARIPDIQTTLLNTRHTYRTIMDITNIIKTGNKVKYLNTLG
jgi:hypothetical protein